MIRPAQGSDRGSSIHHDELIETEIDAVCASVAMIVRSSFSVGMMTEIVIAMTHQP